MANDGLQQLMNKGVVVSGNEPQPVTLGPAESVMSFARWLDWAGADGSIPFAVLAPKYLEAQGWVIEDPEYARKLLTMPELAVRVRPNESLAERAARQHGEPRQGISGPQDNVNVPVTAPTAAIIDGDSVTNLQGRKIDYDDPLNDQLGRGDNRTHEQSYDPELERRERELEADPLIADTRGDGPQTHENVPQSRVDRDVDAEDQSMAPAASRFDSEGWDGGAND